MIPYGIIDMQENYYGLFWFASQAANLVPNGISSRLFSHRHNCQKVQMADLNSVDLSMSASMAQKTKRDQVDPDVQATGSSAEDVMRMPVLFAELLATLASARCAEFLQ